MMAELLVVLFRSVYVSTAAAIAWCAAGPHAVEVMLGVESLPLFYAGTFLVCTWEAWTIGEARRSL